MAENKTITVKLSLVMKTTEEWATESAIITKGMPVVEQLADGSIKMKVGDGVHTFADLEYVSGAVDVSTTITQSASNGYININGKDILVYKPDELDTKLDKTSTNGVQNKVITQALENKIDKDDVLVLICSLSDDGQEGENE